MTNHSYFNLNGYSSSDILQHKLYIRSTHIAEVDSMLLPTGRVINVAGTPYDFSCGKHVGAEIGCDHLYLKECAGYDVNYFLDAPTIKETSATLISSQSGIVMHVFTDQPCIQLYTSNSVSDGTPLFKNGVPSVQYQALCLEAQEMPDAPHHAEIADIMLSPGEIYEKNIIFSFEREESLS